MPYRPKNKFDYYFNAIGELLYLIVFVAVYLFIVGYALYQLFLGNFYWFKENPLVILLIILFSIIFFSVLFTYKKKIKQANSTMIMDNSVTSEELDNYLTFADRARGAIISHTVLLERNMDLFISKYFCLTDEKVFELMELLISERVDLSKKTETFVQILIKECKRSGENFNQKYPRIKTDLKEIYETRNAFAHKLTITPIKTDIGKHVIVLKEFKNKTEILSYTEEDINTIVMKIQKYSSMIKDRNNP